MGKTRREDHDRHLISMCEMRGASTVKCTHVRNSLFGTHDSVYRGVFSKPLSIHQGRRLLRSMSCPEYFAQSFLSLSRVRLF